MISFKENFYLFFFFKFLGFSKGKSLDFSLTIMTMIYLSFAKTTPTTYTLTERHGGRRMIHPIFYDESVA